MKRFLALSLLLFLANGAYQIYQDPLELMRAVPFTAPKSVGQTWRSYALEFEAYSTPGLSAKTLAALTQIESLGDAWAQPPWRWRFTTEPGQIFAPMSTAFGLMQLTTPTFYQAKRLCGRSQQISWMSDSHRDLCAAYTHSRLLPSHSVGLAAIILEYRMRNLLRGQRLSAEKKREMAAIVHLCGPGGGKKFLRNGKKVTRMGRCGTHSVANYVNKFKKVYRKLVRLN